MYQQIKHFGFASTTLVSRDKPSVFNIVLLTLIYFCLMSRNSTIEWTLISATHFFPSLLFWPRHKTRPLMLNCCHLTFVCMHRDQRVRSCRVIWLKLKSEGKWVCFHQIRSMHSTMWSKYFLSSDCLIIIKIQLAVIIYEFYYFLSREVQKVKEIQEVHKF